MNYAKWETKENMKNFLTPVNLKTGVKKTGIPMMYDDEYLYINDKSSHTLVIGSTGSGKTQTMILPTLKLSMMAGESIILNDVKGELYRLTANQLEKEGYNVIALNFDKANLGNSWNPLTLPYLLYKEGQKDKALELIEDLGYYLFTDPSDKMTDPFWTNSVIDYFTGLTLYLFQEAKENEINLSSIAALSNSINKNPKDFLNKFDRTSTIYIYISVTLSAPTDTRGSIVAVFNQKIRLYLTRENLTNMMANTDFDITSIANQKTAVFLISGTTCFSTTLIPLFINQVFDIVDIYGNHERGINILLDEFDTMIPIKEFSKLIHYSRSQKMNFVVTIKSYVDLINMYGKENAEILKMCFGNIVYLLSNDVYTLEEISDMCGKTLNGDSVEPLITVEQLKTLEPFEAVIMMIRMYPLKTKLLPDYKIDWGFEVESKEIPAREINKIEIYNYDN